MKLTKRLLTASALMLLAGYAFFATVRIQRLETRLAQLQLAQQIAPSIAYTFDQSFIDYFGPEGVAQVERSLRALARK